MAARKVTLKPAPERPELEALLAEASKVRMTDEQMAEQRVSFAYGNAPVHLDTITKDSTREASRHNRLITA
jgi:hypothetical protein